MKKLLKFLLTYQIKQAQRHRKSSGFTLIELLLGLILAFLIITPLLGFVVNIMTTDRQEQAKAASEQEIQAALNYISRDLDQAIFIYDGWGLDPANARVRVIQNLPQYPNATPVLVFWKRYFYPKAIPTGGANNCTNPQNCNDAFVNSLVAYYLIDNTNCTNTTWSCTARIGRVEIRGGVPDPTDPTVELKPADPGFVLFDTGAGNDAEALMNAWPPSVPTYTTQPPMETLIDYIDQTPPGGNAPQASCPDTPRSVPRPDQPPFPTRAYTNNPPPYTYRQVPVGAGANAVKSSFYACVNSDSTSAQVFIRGNALARISPNRPNQTPIYNDSKSAYFPQASIQAKGGGLLSTQ